MNEKDESLGQNSIFTTNSKVSIYFDLPQNVKRSLTSNTMNNNMFNNTNNINNSSNNYISTKKNESTFNEKGINTIMINLIKKLIKLKKEGKSSEELYSLLPKMLREINLNITNIINDNNCTLAHLIINEDNIELLKIICNIYYLLLVNKNDFYDWFMKENSENLTVLDIASIKGDKDMLEFLYEIISRTEGNKLKFNIKKNNFFHYSAKFNKYFSILFWYEKLQPYFPYLKIIDLSNEYDITPLHYACYHGAVNCVELLLDLQADINALDKDGKSVLIYAVFSGDIKIIKKLLIRGANKLIKDSEGKTAYDYAIKNNKYGIATFLKDYKYIHKIKKFIRCNYNNIEIQHLKKYRNDFELLVYILFYSIFIIIFSLKLFFESEYKDLTKTFWQMAIFTLVLNYIFLFFSLISIIYFKCIIRFKQHIKKNKNDFLIMYDKTNSNNICVKCIRMKKQNTIHCVVCNLCIDNWDHHCFWLNTCITKNNIKIFSFFLISIMSFLFINIIFPIVFIIIYFFEDKEKRNKFIGSLFNKDIDNINLWKNLYLIICFTIFILFSLYFVYHFILIMLSSKKSKNMTEINDNRESINDINMDEYHGNLIDSYIDKNDD